MTDPMLLVANWKMNLNTAASVELTRELLRRSVKLENSELWIAPATVTIPSLGQILAESHIKLGAQNAHWREQGAFTGEVAVPMLREHGVSFVIVGHSERRHLFGENDKQVVERAKGILEQGMPVIFCVGETLDERERNQTLPVLERQLTALLDVTSENLLTKVTLAYEPVWAIGTGKVAEVADIEAAHAHLQKVWREHVDIKAAPILYGGSVTPDNFEAISELANVNGALVGGASLVADKFLELAKIAERRR